MTSLDLRDRSSAIDVSSDPSDGGPDAEADGSRFAISDEIRRRLTPVNPWVLSSWIAALFVTAIAALLRFINLGLPNELVFDELYYATEGQELIDHGVEWRTETDSAGSVVASYGDFVVHPPLGKWIISLGIRLWGNDPWGWRFMGALAGVLSVLIVVRTARRMFGSTVLACAAGLLMALDGMHLVLSRTAILDIYVMFFVIASFACLVLDRDARRVRWLRAMEGGLDPTRPGKSGRLRLTFAGVPWWRLAAAVLLGCGTAVKWSAVFFLPFFLLLILIWEIGVRKTVGARHPWRDALLDETGWLVAMVVLMFAAYLASWTGWFLHDDGWKRHYLANELGKPELPILGALYNLWAYHVDVYDFHSTLSSPHPYQSWPWQWLILAKPVAFWRNGDAICGAPPCHAEILLLGTPVLWWSFVPALAGLAWFGISRRDWRALAIGAGAFAGVAPWFYYEMSNRTMFYFYCIPAEPFLVLAVVYVLGAFINGPGVGRYGGGRVRTMYSLAPEDRRLYGTIFAGAFMLLVAVCFWYYYPLYVGNSIPDVEYLRRLLLGNRWM